jgi:pilus assembly protein CpaD
MRRARETVRVPSRWPAPQCSRAVLVLAAISVAYGCSMTKRDSVVVGAVPDDYRTNHPIVIAERDHVLDLPVGTGDRAMTSFHRVAVDGYMADYDRQQGALVRIIVPSGAINSAAASSVAHNIAQHMYKKGVPTGRVVIAPYDATGSQGPAPIRIAYGKMTAATARCGRWPDDVLNTVDNRHYANFGCSYQNNLAAQVANPADLLGPRAPGDIEAERRSTILNDYRDAPTWIDIPRREINY